MRIANIAQIILIDTYRTDQCKHPKAITMRGLFFLACHRCGCLFAEGNIATFPIIREEDEVEGVKHWSSYACADDDDILRICANQDEFKKALIESESKNWPATIDITDKQYPDQPSIVATLPPKGFSDD